MITKKSIKMDSDYIKTMIMSNFRFSKQFSFVATEVMYADVLSISKDDKKLIEVEVKISKSDLLSDFAKFKHELYRKAQGDFVPHEFYYCVPNELVGEALKMTEDTPYGVMECRKWRGDLRASSDKILVRKRAKKLHKNEIPSTVKNTIVARMASELINCKLKLLTNEVVK